MPGVATFDDPEFFGEHWAEVYDEGGDLDPAPAVEFLAGLAGDRRALELAVGTGRVALPLAARGIAVEGIEASEAMVERLRAKPGGDGIPVVIADMADVAVTGPFQLVYLVYNTLFNLPNAERQADCFRNVARVLEPDGAFVLECFVLDPSQYDRGQRVEALSVEEDSVVLQVSRHDAAAQRLFKQHLVFDAGGFRGFPVALRYCWPSELDLMARLAGLELAERYAGWDRGAFGSESQSHVSVYRPARSDHRG
jgi:SAM-dependent methyltransferase